jgi:hypothetical protein
LPAVQPKGGAKAVRTGDIQRRRAFLDALVVWLSRNVDLSVRFEHPTIQFVPAQTIVAMRNTAFLNDPTKVAAVQGDVVSVYNMELAPSTSATTGKA